MKSFTVMIFLQFSTLVGFAQAGNILYNTIRPINLGYTINLYSIILNESRTIFIHLPDNYTKDLNPCPVLYLFDAETNFKPVCGVVEILCRWKVIPGLIVVGIPNTDRMRDVTPTHEDRKS